MQEKRAQRAPGIVWGRMRWLMWARACLQGEQWKKTTLTTALLYPGVVFAIFFACNLLVWGQKSSGAGASSKRRLFQGTGYAVAGITLIVSACALSNACLRMGARAYCVIPHCPSMRSCTILADCTVGH